MIKSEKFIEELKRIRKQCERKLKSSEEKLESYTKLELSKHGYWSKGYLEGNSSAYENIINIIDDLINNYKLEQEINNYFNEFEHEMED